MLGEPCPQRWPSPHFTNKETPGEGRAAQLLEFRRILPLSSISLSCSFSQALLSYLHGFEKGGGPAGRTVTALCPPSGLAPGPFQGTATGPKAGNLGGSGRAVSGVFTALEADTLTSGQMVWG